MRGYDDYEIVKNNFLAWGVRWCKESGCSRHAINNKKGTYVTAK